MEIFLKGVHRFQLGRGVDSMHAEVNGANLRRRNICSFPNAKPGIIQYAFHLDQPKKRSLLTLDRKTKIYPGAARPAGRRLLGALGAVHRSVLECARQPSQIVT